MFMSLNLFFFCGNYSYERKESMQECRILELLYLWNLAFLIFLTLSPAYMQNCIFFFYKKLFINQYIYCDFSLKWCILKYISVFIASIGCFFKKTSLNQFSKKTENCGLCYTPPLPHQYILMLGLQMHPNHLIKVRLWIRLYSQVWWMTGMSGSCLERFEM